MRVSLPTIGRPARRARALAGLVAIAALAPAGCGRDGGPGAIVVLAAASTAETVRSIAADWSVATGTEVVVSSGPSNALARQVIAGAPADLLLSANRRWADAVADEGRAADAVDLLRNRLVVVVPAGDDGGPLLDGLRDLLDPAFARIALAAPGVPAGIHAEEALGAAGVLEPLAGAGRIVRGVDVSATLVLVELGEVDAGMVYATDAAASTRARTALEIDPTLHEPITAVLVLVVRGDGGHPSARALYDHLAGDPAAIAAFEAAGFELAADRPAGEGEATAARTGSPAR